MIRRITIDLFQFTWTLILILFLILLLIKIIWLLGVFGELCYLLIWLIIFIELDKINIAIVITFTISLSLVHRFKRNFMPLFLVFELIYKFCSFRIIKILFWTSNLSQIITIISTDYLTDLLSKIIVIQIITCAQIHLGSVPLDICK